MRNHPGLLRRLVQTWARMRAARRRFAPAPAPAGVPKVSVMVIAYNHERYIAQALDGILMQERDFEIEINVIDDASTDRTQEIAREYERRHPGIVRCFFGKTNLGHIATQLNTYRGFQTLRGQYFAILEGDDYWTDPRKLRTQVRFLDRHPQYVACAHDTLKVYEDGSRPPEHFLPFKAFGRQRATLRDVVGLAGVFHLSSLVYRNVFGTRPPLCLSDPYSCEATVNMVYGQFGDFRYLPGYMSVYRAHGMGVFSGRSVEDHWVFHLHGFRRFALYLGPRSLYFFVRAIAGFSAFALSAWKRGEGPRMGWRRRLLFAVHLLVARPLFLVLHPMHAACAAAREIGRSVAHLRARGVRGPAPEDPPPLLVQVLHTRAAFRAVRSGRALPPAATHERAPKVSVVVTTCNHAGSVARAVESVLAQQRSFAIEIDVVDDGSTDGTREEALALAARHPGLVRCFLHEPHDGEASWQRNLHRGLQTARGCHVALLNGADYWCDPYKLARQVAFLDAHPRYVGCGHDILEVADGEAPSQPRDPQDEGADADIDALLRQSIILPYSSLVCRNLFGSHPPWCIADPFNSPSGMTVVWAQFGPLRRLPGAMAAQLTHVAAGTEPAAEAQVQAWLFQLRAFRRLALYLGGRHLHRFAQVTEGFCTYVLTSSERSVPPLPPQARRVFAAHRAVVRAVLPVLRGGRHAWSALHGARAYAAATPGRLYRFIVRISPAWLLRTVVAAEMRWPRIQALRRGWKHVSDLQFHDKG